MTDETGRNCKVDRVARRWDLENIDEQLRDRREAEDSLRELEAYYNKQVLQSAMQDAGFETLQGEVANMYELLTSDDVSSGTEVEARARLEQNSVDSDALLNDFVSYQTIRTHLRDCLDIDTDRETGVTRSEAKNTVFKMISRTEHITERTIERLRSSGHLLISDVTVTLSLRIGCGQCGDEYTFSRLLERGSCSCSDVD